MCEEEVETSCHALVDCKAAEKVWKNCTIGGLRKFSKASVFQDLIKDQIGFILKGSRFEHGLCDNVVYMV